MNLIKTWDSLMDTQRTGKYNYRCVSNCCLDKQKQQIDSFIQKEVDIIIINPVSANSPKLIKALNHLYVLTIV